MPVKAITSPMIEVNGKGYSICCLKKMNDEEVMTLLEEYKAQIAQGAYSAGYDDGYENGVNAGYNKAREDLY